MNLLLWIVFGALAGWIASIIAKTNSTQGLLGDVILGIIGSIIGGVVFSFFGESGVNGFNLRSLLVAIVGSLIVLWLGRVLSSHSTM